METKARREYHRLLSQLLDKGEQGDLVQKVELLRYFLESGELPRFRAESEKYFVEGKKAKFRFYLENGQPKYEMKVF